MSDLAEQARASFVENVRTIKGDQEVVQAAAVVTAHHIPGAALETAEDYRIARAREAEPVADTEVPEAPEYEGIDTRSPAANIATRGNIVPSEHYPYTP